MPSLTLKHLWPASWPPQVASASAAKSSAPNFEGLPAQVVALKHAPPPSRKMTSLSELGPGLTPIPVEEPSRHRASGNATQVQTPGASPVIALPLAAASGASTPVSLDELQATRMAKLAS